MFSILCVMLNKNFSFATTRNRTQPHATRRNQLFNTMAAVLPNILDTTPEDWRLTPAKKPPKSMTWVSYANVSSTNRNNPRFQIKHKLRVKYPPSPGYQKSREDHPYDRCNVELAVPRALEELHNFFNNRVDPIGIRHTYENQEQVWPKKRPKNLEDLVPEDLFRPSIPDNQNLIDNGWDPSLRTKAVPPGPDGPDKTKKLTKVWIAPKDRSEKAVPGTIDDIHKDDDLYVCLELEGWWASKDSSGFTYRIYECVVFKNTRPTECGLDLAAMMGGALDEVPDVPITKRMRPSPGSDTDQTNGSATDSGTTSLPLESNEPDTSGPTSLPLESEEGNGDGNSDGETSIPVEAGF